MDIMIEDNLLDFLADYFVASEFSENLTFGEWLCGYMEGLNSRGV